MPISVLAENARQSKFLGKPVACKPKDAVEDEYDACIGKPKYGVGYTHIWHGHTDRRAHLICKQGISQKRAESIDDQ